MVIVEINKDSTYKSKPITDFRQGIKRNPNLFPILDRETRWDNFNQALMIEIKA